MWRWLLGGVVLCAAAVAAGMWLCGPTPSGDSLFANWQPQARGKVWTIAGSPGSKRYIFIDPNGAFQPRRDSYSIHCFVYDRETHRLYSPLAGGVRVRRNLLQGCLPSPSLNWDAGELAFTQTTFAYGDACYSIVHIESGSHYPMRVSLFLAAVPYGVTGAMHAPAHVRYDERSRSIVVDGEPLLTCDGEPTYGAAIASELPNDITSYVRKGGLPVGRSAYPEPRTVTSAAVQFDLTLQPHGSRVFEFRSPSSLMNAQQYVGTNGVRAKQAQTAFETEWRRRLARAKIAIPDKRLADCYNASVAYLAMLSADGEPVPGPTKYRGFWVRDCAYMTDGLYYAGQQDLIPPALRQLRSMQLGNGGFAPKLGMTTDDELDAPGEAIYALVSQYRRTGDQKWLEQQWSCILRASRYIRAKRRGGILPASVSAEDLGDTLQQHYWDDFWCIRGLRDAAFAARALGKSQDAAWISAEAESLLHATKTSIRDTMARSSVGCIPNGPDEVMSSSAARGTSCALWPCAVLDTNDPLVKRSYDAYYSKWIAPSGGGFVHRKHYWPYAGLDLAQGYLMMGQRDRAFSILSWTLDHDPTHGFFAWPEGMFTKDLTLAEGDMPHGWMCAAVVSLVRNMLVRESGDDLVLLSGVPKQWLKPGAEIAVRDFPTEFGKVSYRAKVSRDGVKLTLSGARPSGRYRIALPDRDVVDVPSGAREIAIPLD